MPILDRRDHSAQRTAPSRKKFIDRVKHALGQKARELITKGSIKDALKKKVKVPVAKKYLEEPEFGFDHDTGTHRRVLPGNKKFTKGDKIPVEKGGSGSGGGTDPGEGDETSNYIWLNPKEFFDILFSDLELPDYIKESLAKDYSVSRERAGYTKVGIQPQLDLEQTFKAAYARKLATDTLEDEESFLQEVDLRYRNYEQLPNPIKTARVYCILDVSISISDREKDIARRFLMLFYMFLSRNYKDVEIVFITHTDSARIVEEEEFFYGTRTGGTYCASGLQLAYDDIVENVDVMQTNLYMVQISDGQVMAEDATHCIALYEESLLPVLQYAAYIQLCGVMKYHSSHQEAQLYRAYGGLVELYERFHRALVGSASDVVPLLVELFKK